MLNLLKTLAYILSIFILPLLGEYIDCVEMKKKPSIDVYWHPVTPRKSDTEKDVYIPIKIAIAYLPKELRYRKSSLGEKNLEKIFKYINEGTIDRPYPCEPDRGFQINGRMVYRPSHNGTHSARQAHYLKILFDLIEKKGNARAKKILRKLSDEDKVNLLLGAYCLRTGRVDDRSYLFDPNYGERSTLVYEQYAQQLNFDKEKIHWVKTSINKLQDLPNLQEVGESVYMKYKLSRDLLAMIHYMDLVRCFHEKSFKNTLTCMGSLLDSFIDEKTSLEKRDFILKELVQIAQFSCRITGEKVAYSPFPVPRNERKFSLCSWDAVYVWRELKKNKYFWRI